MPTPLFEYISKTGLQFFYRQIKQEIMEHNMSIVDITGENSIPQLDGTHATIYYVDNTNTTIPKSDSSTTSIPSSASGSDLFIINNCTEFESGKKVNDYLLIDDSSIYTGKVTVSSSGTTTIGSWNKICNPSDYLVELTQAQYDALSTAQKNNGKVYFITDADSQVLSAPDIINTMIYKGEIISSNLPASGSSTGDYYYLTDKLEGRYWNGSQWKVVK